METKKLDQYMPGTEARERRLTEEGDKGTSGVNGNVLSSLGVGGVGGVSYHLIGVSYHLTVHLGNLLCVNYM